MSITVTSPLAITSIASGTSAQFPEFTLGTVTGCTVDPSGSTLLPTGTVCTVPVTFSPSFPGFQSAPFRINTVAGGVKNVFAVGLIGTGNGTLPVFANTTATTIETGLSSPTDIAVDSAGNQYIASLGTNSILSIIVGASGSTSIAGTGAAGYNGDGIPANSAQLNAPLAIALDVAGNLYIADSGNNRIRRVDANGMIRTVAGTGTAGYNGDGFTATSAELNDPQSIAVDLAGNLYIADSGNNRVRRVDANGNITTIAGIGTAGYNGDSIAATTAQLNSPVGVAISTSGSLYIADALNNRLRLVNSGGTISTVAGTGIGGYNGDGIPAATAQLNYPSRIAVDDVGDIYLVDLENFRTRKIDSSGTIITVLGSGIPTNVSPYGTALDNERNLYVADSTNGDVLEITYAGTEGYVPPALGFNFPTPTADGTIDATDGWKSAIISNLGNVSWTEALDIEQSSDPSYNDYILSNGADPKDCSIVSPLAPGASCNLNIEFAPTGDEEEAFDYLYLRNSSISYGISYLGLSGTGIPPPLIIMPSVLPAGSVGAPYSVVFSANGVPIDQFGVSGLPPGLEIQEVTTDSASVSGTPTLSGTFTVDVTAYSPAQYHSHPDLYGSATYTLVINPMPSATTIAVTSAGRAVTSLTSGSVLTLTASVSSGTTPVTPGMVKFCDATAATCTGTHLLGTAQLTSVGVATFRFVPGIGNHNYYAVFVGTVTYLTSTSIASSLTVTQPTPLPSTTAIAEAGTVGNYTLTATASGSLTPTGSISFLDTNNGNAVVATALLPTGVAGVSFLNSSDPVVGNYPRCIAVADFNGDGFNDLAVGNFNDGTIQILFGDGHGNFTASTKGTFSVQYPNSIASADINGDGIPDLVVTTFGPAYGNGGVSGITILIGDGSGGFTSSTTSSLYGTYAVALGDFNGDGIADVAVTNYYSNTLSVLGNSIPTVNGPTGISAGDFNGDGILDLVVAYTNGLSILLGNGAGNFTPVNAEIFTGNSPVSIAVADFNGDGILDLAAANSASPFVTVVLGNGDGTFRATPTNPVSNSNSYSIAAADLNGDGNQDLVVANQGGAPTILLGDGKGGFTASAPITLAGSGGEAVALGDLNGDGIQDIVVANYPLVSTLLTQLAQTVTVTSISPIGTGVHQIDASYSGNSQLSSSLSSTTAVNTQPLGTSLSLSPTPTSAQVDQPVTLTANLMPFQSAEGINAAGLVTFYSGPQTLGISNLTNGTAKLTTSSLAVGTDSLTATYGGNANFAGSSSPSLPFVVSGTSPSISFAVANTTYGIAPFNVSATSNSTGAITYSVVSGPATVNGSTVTITGAGTVVLQASQAAAGTYGTGSQTATFTVAPAIPTISFTISGQTYGAAPFTVMATSNSAGAITYSVVSGPATILGSTVTLTGIGTVVLKASQVAAGNYSAGSQTASFSVAAETPTIAFSVANQTYGASPFTVTATSNSSGTISYSVVSGPATISGGTVTLTGTGTVMLKASEVATGNYTAGTQTASFSVLPETPTIAFSVANQIFGASPFILAATSNSPGAITYSVVSGPATISGATVTLTGVGTVVLKASQVASGNYTSTTQTATFIVSAEVPTIVFAVPNQTYGTAPLVVAATSNSSGAFVYSVVSGPATISGATMTLTGLGTVVLKASQSAAGNYTAGTQTATFTVSTSNAPSVKLSPTTLTFPSTNVGSVSANQTVILTNTGTATLNISGVNATGTNASSFYVPSRTCGTALAAGANCTLSVGFRPKASGTLTGSISIIDNAGNSPQTIAVKGTAVASPVVKFSSGSLIFPSTDVGATSATQAVTLTNTGDATLKINYIISKGTDPASFFDPSNTCGTSVAAGASCTINIAFRPRKPTALTDTIYVNDNAAGGEQGINVSGTGIAEPLVTLSPTSLTFASTTVGTTSAAQTVTLKNTGFAVLDISYFSTTGTNASSFSVPSKTCASTLAVNASCTFNVVFKPQATGALSGDIAIHDNAVNSPQGLKVSGTGK